MLVACIAIAGIPPFAGFFSKDEILSAAFASGHMGVWIAGLLAAVITAFYMFRLYLMTFRGTPRLTHEAEHHLHESPAVMIAPLVVLAVLSIVGGWVGLPFQEGGHMLARWLAPVFGGEGGHAAAHEMSAGAEWALIEALAARTEVSVSLPYEPARPAFASPAGPAAEGQPTRRNGDAGINAPNDHR